MVPLVFRWQGRTVSTRLLALVGAILLIGYSYVVVALLALEYRLVFHPVPASRRWIDPPTGCRYTDLELLAYQGAKIHARWYPCPASQTAVLICHSRTGNLSYVLNASHLARWHSELGASVLIFDYPGYGRSEGNPSEAGCYAAASAAYDWLTQVQGTPPENVLFFGRSLGTAVATELASRRRHRALILVSPFTSLPDVANSPIPLLPARWLMRNRFDSLSRIGQCSRPIFVVHGTRDSLVPFEMGKAIFAAANEPKRLFAVEGARHGSCFTPVFYPALRSFLLDVEADSRGNKR